MNNVYIYLQFDSIFSDIHVQKQSNALTISFEAKLVAILEYNNEKHSNWTLFFTLIDELIAHQKFVIICA